MSRKNSKARLKFVLENLSKHQDFRKNMWPKKKKRECWPPQLKKCLVKRLDARDERVRTCLDYPIRTSDLHSQLERFTEQTPRDPFGRASPLLNAGVLLRFAKGLSQKYLITGSFIKFICSYERERCR